tara:strand:+ start:608 stop:2323 length:1716 start_codon:yes stop_codon:yes gene_type:complete
LKKLKKTNRKISGGQIAVKSLMDQKVKYVFGLIGSATMEIFDALYGKSKIKFIGVRDERTGTHMADGYARASGNVGIILAGQNGPGATNLVTGLAQASAAFSPVVSIAGASPIKSNTINEFQKVDQNSLFKPVTKKVFNISKTEQIEKIISDAFIIAKKPRSGPVHLNVPRDILSTFIKYKKTKFKKKNILKTKNNNFVKKINQTVKMLLKASKPVIIVGGGVKNSGNYTKILTLAKLLNSPIVTSAGHGDAIPYNNKFNAGQMGPRGNEVATNLTRNADVILALGTRLGFNSTFYSYDNINKKANIIQINQDKNSIGSYFPIKLGISADFFYVIKELINRFKIMKKKPNVDDWTNNFFDAKFTYLKNRDKNALSLNNSKLIQPASLFKVLRDTLPKNSLITLDAGTLCLQATDALNYMKPPCLFTPLDFGLVGFSFACGLGVKVAKPNRPVISFIGDGGFGMTISELSTAVQYGINTITIIMNNKCWGAEKAYQRDFFGKRYIGADIKSPAFDKLAELYGAKGFKVEKISEFKKAINAALKCKKPAIINVMLDPKALYSFRKDSFKHRKK